jgi:hypothetical protein
MTEDKGMKNFIYFILCIVLVTLAGCSTVDYCVVNPDIKANDVKKVAVFPFALAVDDYAALRVSGAREGAGSLVSSVFVKEFVRKTRYEIISPAEVCKKLSLDKDKLDWFYKSFLGNPYDRGAITPERLKELAAQLDAEAVLAGEITDFGRYQQDGILWTGVGLRIIMVDITRAQIMWEARDKIALVSTITHAHSTLEADVASYPVVIGAVDKEPKYNTGQGYFYGRTGDFPYHIDYKNSTQKLCRKIISTLPPY